MEKKSTKILRIWNEDRSLSIMLVLLLLFIFIFIPILSRGKGGAIFIKIIYTFILITGILSVTRQRKYIIGISILAFISMFVSWLTVVKPTLPALMAHDLCTIVFNFFFGMAILVKTFKAGEITYHRIVGSIVVYLLVGLIFAYVYHAVYLFAGASSFNNISSINLRGFLYFSLTSLTTMGYGDITPIHPMARSFANLEALIGQLYPAILIARLVTMEFESSHKKKEKM